ncbi:MAG: chaperonin GroEL [Chlamydiota bacterium]
MSNPKDILFAEEAREKLRKGIDTLAEVVSVTIGPKGRNVGLQSFGTPTITNDGNSIVKEIDLKDPYENMGVAFGKEVASKIKEKCGDGTTTGILLLRSLVQGGIKNISSGSSPIYIKRGMEKALELVLAEINSMAVPVKGEKETQNIATVSASGNVEIGEKIAQCFHKVGKDGVIIIEEGKGTETVIELVEGMELDRGYISPYLCTNMEKMNIEMQNAHVLITDKKISTVHDILNILQHVASVGKELLIIADDIEGDALSALVINKLRGTLKVAAIKAPGFGDQRKALLEDIAVLTKGVVITEEKGLNLRDATVDLLGSVEKLVVTKDKTTIVNGKGDPKEIGKRIAQIDEEIKQSTNPYDKEKLEQRKAKLKGGVAVLRIGAPTEPEMKQKKQMFEDSLSSTRAALEDGIVPGGGIALLRASKIVSGTKFSLDEALGADILIRACEAPCRQIIYNSGKDNGSVIIEEILRGSKNMGFNVVSDKVEDLLKAGVVDPVKVVKNCLIHAVSVAGIVILSEVLISDAEEEQA